MRCVASALVELVKVDRASVVQYIFNASRLFADVMTRRIDGLDINTISPKQNTSCYERYTIWEVPRHSAGTLDG